MLTSTYKTASGSKFVVRGILAIVGMFMCFDGCTAYAERYVEDECSRGSFSVELSRDGINSVAIIRASRHTSYKYSMDCLVEIFVSTKQQDRTSSSPGNRLRRGLTIGIMQVEMRSQFDGICQDYIEIYEGRTASGRKIYDDCTSLKDIMESTSYDSHEGALSFKYHTDRDGLDNKSLSGYFGFQFTVTAFVLPEDHSSLDNDTIKYFKCDNGRFVWSGLTCDGHNNCGDLSDESEFGSANCKPSKAYMIYLIVGGALLASFFLASIIVLVLQSKRRGKRRRLRTLIRTRREMVSPNIQHSQIS